MQHASAPSMYRQTRQWCPFDASSTEGSALFCVFDGHSGSQAAVKAKAIIRTMLDMDLDDP